MIERRLTSTLLRLAEAFPVIVMTGPRQSGKTTLSRAVFADKPYVSLENPDERAFAVEDPKGFLKRFENGAVFDEAQRWPELFSWLQGMVDENPAPGRFVITGSQQFGLLAGVSQSLAGRAGMTHLLPLSLSEIPGLTEQRFSLDTLMITGGYPALYSRPLSPEDWFASYVATYVERDIRQVLKIQDLSAFQRFLRLCAGRNGQLLNLSALAGEAGISQSTARAWLSVLESSYLVHLLPPYYRNFGKRLVKSPKLYFLDVGLASWLLGIRSAETLALHPFRGALFESLVVSEFIKARYNKGLPADLYFWRDNNGVEADLVFESGAKLQPVEIKSGSTVTSDYIKAGQRAGKFATEETDSPWLIYGGDESYERSGVKVVGWRDVGDWV
ncbi:ATP-binding protein [Chlorobaculum sp. 24CR]|uniref:ATP-binding protein n=1 Tax=Chlorobaculum sp. 24CR TaxID=2508878 RepID=UPI00100BBA7F|nr:ATP-binding protein [Chlorobaculum sp. 24CR]